MKKNCVSCFTSALPRSSLRNAITGMDCAAHKITSSSDAVTNDATSETARWLKNDSEPSYNRFLNLFLILSTLSLSSINAMDVDPAKNSRKRSFAETALTSEASSSNAAEANNHTEEEELLVKKSLIRTIDEEKLADLRILVDTAEKHIKNDTTVPIEIFFSAHAALSYAAKFRGELYVTQNIDKNNLTMPDTEPLEATLQPLDNALTKYESFALCHHDLSESVGVSVFLHMTGCFSLHLLDCKLPHLPPLPKQLKQLVAPSNPIGTDRREAPLGSEAWDDANYLPGGAEMSLIHLKECVMLEELNLERCDLPFVIATSTIKTLKLSQNPLGRNTARIWQLCVDNDITTLSSLTKLFLAQCGFTTLPDLSGMLPVLQELELDRNNFNAVTRADWQKFAQSLPTLTQLSLCMTNISQPIPLPPSLRTLFMSDNNFAAATAIDWQEFFSRLPQLEFALFSNCCLTVLPTFLPPTLLCLDISHNNFSRVTASEWNSFFAFMPNLKDLSLKDCRITSLPIPQQHLAMEEISLHNNPSLRTAPPADWQRFFAAFPALEKVKLEGCCIGRNEQMALRTAYPNIVFDF